ncbi:MAG: hypothetical protein AABW79_03875 [Nanoarchaeota archaeon]
MNVKNIVLGIGIFIVFMFLLHNGIRAFYDTPRYENFDSCRAAGYGPGGEYFGYSYPTKLPGTENCSIVSGIREQEQQCSVQGGQVLYDYDDAGCITGFKECNFCQQEFNEAMKKYNKNIFIIALVIGIIVLIVGFTILSVEPVGSALMASGIGAIVYGTIVNWENLGNLGRFLLLLFALVLLVWIALRINRQEKKGFFGKFR